MDYVSPDGRTGLKISALDFAGPPMQNFQQLETELKGPGDHQLSGYHRLRLNPTKVTIGGTAESAALWEFTWQGKLRPYHAIDLGFGQEGATAYALYLSAPDSEWSDQKPRFETAVATFRPAS